MACTRFTPPLASVEPLTSSAGRTDAWLGDGRLALPEDATRRRWLRSALGALLPLGVASTLPGCALLGIEPDEAAEPPLRVEDLSDSDWARASRLVAGEPQWLHLRFRGRKPTRYSASTHQGRPVIAAHSEGGSSVMRQQMTRPAAQPSRLAWSWWVDSLHSDFDIRTRDTDDAVARVIVTFDGNRANFTARDALLSELAQLLTGQALPHATIEYIWDPRLPVGTVLSSSYSTRVRYIVVESGPARLSQWVEAERDLQADFASAFNEPPTAITGVGLMTDANDTATTARAWFGPMRWATA